MRIETPRSFWSVHYSTQEWAQVQKGLECDAWRAATQSNVAVEITDNLHEPDHPSVYRDQMVYDDARQGPVKEWVRPGPGLQFYAAQGLCAISPAKSKLLWIIHLVHSFFINKQYQIKSKLHSYNDSSIKQTDVKATDVNVFTAWIRKFLVLGETNGRWDTVQIVQQTTKTQIVNLKLGMWTNSNGFWETIIRG